MPTAFPLFELTKQMFSSFKIELKSSHELDAERWDRCIGASPNESPLAYSWVLNRLSPGWQGIVLNNYEGVMPIPVTRRAGFNLLQMPYEVLTLGLFSPEQNIRNLFPAILYHSIMGRYRFVTYNGSPGSTKKKDFPGIETRLTYRLNLNKSYDTLYRQFSRSHRRSIREFDQSGLIISTTPCPEAFTRLLAIVGEERPELYMPPDYRKKFEDMTSHAIDLDYGTTCTVWQEQELIGAAFFLIGKKRAIPYHLVTAKGREAKVAFGLINHFIRNHADTGMELDFAGSMITNVTAFNQRFGAAPAEYLSVTINKLPVLWRLAKKMRLSYHARRIFHKKNYPQ